MTEANGSMHNATDRAGVVLDRLRAQGERITTSRRVIVELLASTDDHLTIEDIAVRLQAMHPEIHLSTVYRTLDGELAQPVRRASGRQRAGELHDHLRDGDRDHPGGQHDRGIRVR